MLLGCGMATHLFNRRKLSDYQDSFTYMDMCMYGYPDENSDDVRERHEKERQEEEKKQTEPVNVSKPISPRKPHPPARKPQSPSQPLDPEAERQSQALRAHARAKSTSWACRKCTLINTGDQCTACGTDQNGDGTLPQCHSYSKKTGRREPSKKTGGREPTAAAPLKSAELQTAKPASSGAVRATQTAPVSKQTTQGQTPGGSPVSGQAPRAGQKKDSPTKVSNTGTASVVQATEDTPENPSSNGHLELFLYAIVFIQFAVISGLVLRKWQYVPEPATSFWNKFPC